MTDLKSVKIWIDCNFAPSGSADAVLTQLASHYANFIVDKLPVDNCVMWSRLEAPDGSSETSASQ